MAKSFQNLIEKMPEESRNRVEHYQRGIIQKVFEMIDASCVSSEDKAQMIEEFNQDALLNEKLAEKEKTIFEKGRKERDKEIVRNMLKMKTMTIDQIAHATGLTLEQINTLSME